MSWRDLALEPDVLSRLERLNDERYLEHKTGQMIEVLRLRDALSRCCSIVEIGSNRGRFARGLAECHRDDHVLAIEWRQKWLNRMRADLAKGRLDNLSALRADARIALPILAPSGSVRRLFILYPDPWWKRRHQHRRLLDDAFLSLVGDLLEPGGLLIIKTDVLLTRERIVEAIAAIDGLELLDPWHWPDERPWTPSTRERQCLTRGIPTYRVVAGKKGG